MAQYGSFKTTFGTGETVGVGWLEEQVSITYNQATGEPLRV